MKRSYSTAFALWATLIVVTITLAYLPNVCAAPPQLGEPAPAQPTVLSTEEIDALITEFNKNKTEATGKIVLDEIAKAIGAQRQAEEFTEAIKLTEKAMQVARSIKSDRHKGFADLKKTLTKDRYDYNIKKTLHAALEKNPNSTYTRERLIKLYILKYDNVEKAAELVTEEVDKSLQAVVNTIQKPIDKLSAEECLAAGNWYYTNGRDELHALKKAKAYFERFLKLHTKKDAPFLHVTHVLEVIEKENRIPTTKTLNLKLRWQPVMEVKKGQKLVITATGEWKDANGRTSMTPDGNREVTPKGAKPRTTGYLQGRIGNDIFRIGSKATLTVPNDGILEMQVHQVGGNYSNNVGTLTVTITPQ